MMASPCFHRHPAEPPQQPRPPQAAGLEGRAAYWAPAEEKTMPPVLVQVRREERKQAVDSWPLLEWLRLQSLLPSGVPHASQRLSSYGRWLPQRQGQGIQLSEQRMTVQASA